MAMMFKARKRLRAFLLLLAFLICQIFLFVSPVQAFTSLNNCAANSACAVTLANELGLKTAVKNAVATSSPRLISVSGAITKSAVAEVAYGTGTLAFFTGAAVSYAYLSRSEVESLQETAMANFCSQYPDVIVCGNYDLTFYNVSKSKSETEKIYFHTLSILSSTSSILFTSLKWGLIFRHCLSVKHKCFFHSELFLSPIVTGFL